MKRDLALAAAIVLVAAVGRTAWDARAYRREAEAALATGSKDAACEAYGLLLHRWIPGSSQAEGASRALVALAREAEAGGDLFLARTCWEELRSGWLSVRGWWQPGASWITEAEAALPDLYLKDLRATWPDPALPLDTRRELLRQSLAQREDPSALWAMVLELGFGLWFGGATMAIVRGLPTTDDGPVLWPALRRWALLSFGGWLLFLLGAWRA